MTRKALILYAALGLAAHAQQPVAPVTVLRQPDGGSITFQRRTTPPAGLVQAGQPEVLTAEEIATRARREGKVCELVVLSANVHENGTVTLHCILNEGHQLRAVSNADFRLFAGVGTVETETKVYNLVLAAGISDGFLSPEEAQAAQQLPAAATPAFVLTEGKASLTEGEAKALEALEALHEYFTVNRDALAQIDAQRKSDQAAKALALRNAPPPPPKQAVVQFWKLPQAATSSSGDSTHSAGGASQP